MGLSSPRHIPVPLQVELLERRLALSSTANPAVVPVPGVGEWLVRQEHLAHMDKGNPAVVFLGDSILARFAHGAGESAWKDMIAPFEAADFAIGGSETENLLWEIDQGQLSGITPSVVVLLIGTNNLSHGQSPEDAAAGVAACVADIQMMQPGARILLLGILPRGPSPDAPLGPLIAQTNGLLAQLDTGGNVSYLDVGSLFLGPDGRLPAALMPDGVHPSTEGYRLLAAALQGPLQQLLGGQRPLPQPTPQIGTPYTANAER